MMMMSLPRFRGGLVFKAHRLVYHSSLGWRVIKKKAAHRGVVEVDSGYTSALFFVTLKTRVE